MTKGKPTGVTPPQTLKKTASVFKIYDIYNPSLNLAQILFIIFQEKMYLLPTVKIFAAKDFSIVILMPEHFKNYIFKPISFCLFPPLFINDLIISQCLFFIPDYQ
jgi:hypothetical protein